MITTLGEVYSLDSSSRLDGSDIVSGRKGGEVNDGTDQRTSPLTRPEHTPTSRLDGSGRVKLEWW